VKPFPHRYDVRLDGGPAGYADVSADGLPSIRMEAPTTYDGPGDAWSPEHLLLASVEACFLLTFRAVARLSGTQGLETLGGEGQSGARVACETKAPGRERSDRRQPGERDAGEGRRDHGVDERGAARARAAGHRTRTRPR